MNILFITSAKSWGGGEVWLSQISRGLRSRGHRACIVCRPEAEFLMRAPDTPDLYPVNLSGDFHPLAILRLYRIIRREAIDLICVNMEKELRLGCVAGYFAGVPVVHSREVDRPIKDTLVNRIFFRHMAAGIIVNSHATKKTLLESAPWLADQRVEVIWKGIDMRPFMTSSGGARKCGPDGEVVAGFIGRLDAQKGITTLLEAIRLVRAGGARVKFCVAGEGNLRPMIEEFIARYSLQESVDLLGYRDDVPEILSAVDFLLMPSVWEGFGYSAVEAMAAGKPVIASDVSSLREIISDGDDGILVPPLSPEKLADAILLMAGDPGLRKRLGDNARRTVVRKFSFDTMLASTEAVFRSCTSR
ncbi:MAG TPA: glycosyltransferase family 4 protein [Bacteroidota bacterium]|nr:glycosyltransferase family 4 protein [Bacteroidota bacterium]